MTSAQCSTHFADSWSRETWGPYGARVPDDGVWSPWRRTGSPGRLGDDVRRRPCAQQRLLRRHLHPGYRTSPLTRRQRCSGTRPGTSGCRTWGLRTSKACCSDLLGPSLRRPQPSVSNWKRRNPPGSDTSSPWSSCARQSVLLMALFLESTHRTCHSRWSFSLVNKQKLCEVVMWVSSLLQNVLRCKFTCASLVLWVFRIF